MTLLATSPILLLLFFLLVLRKSLSWAAPIALCFTILLALFTMNIPAPLLGAGVLQGGLIALDMFFIIFGAIFFLEILKQQGLIEAIKSQLMALSADRRIQAILICWFFGSFLEGSAGFGTPAAIVAPLLVALGFPPMTAILAALVANTTSVTFGAVGTPVRVGMSGLETEGVAVKAALVQLFAGLSVPLMIVAFIVKTDSQSSWKSFWNIMPWAVWAGLAFLIPFMLFSTIGEEFPSLLGAPIGLVLMILSLKRGFLVPKSTWRFSSDLKTPSIASGTHFVKTLAPYILLISLILLGRYFFSSMKISIPLPQGQSYSWSLFNPGFAFITTVLFLILYWRLPFKEVKWPFFVAANALLTVVLSIFSISALIQIMMKSRMIDQIAAVFSSSTLLGTAPFLGAFGSFFSGSATVSNLLLAPIEAFISSELGLSLSWVLALQLVGSGIGNMIALSNILAVQATVGVEKQESMILRALLIPCFLYVILSALTGLLAQKFIP